MKIIKSLVLSNFKEITHLFICSFCSLTLLLLRLKLTGDYLYLFLVWNLFLAAIPFLITLLVQYFPRWAAHPLLFGVSFFGWLLFLPNAPYLVTDLIHLRLSTQKTVWFDFLMIANFAFAGLLYGYYTVKTMALLLYLKFGKRTAVISTIIIIYLSALGVYIGRFLRWNSWDFLSNPTDLLTNILFSLKDPFSWIFTLLFGSLLLAVHFGFFSWYSGHSFPSTKS